MAVEGPEAEVVQPVGTLLPFCEDLDVWFDLHVLPLRLIFLFRV